MITRCVGANSDVVPDVYAGAVRLRDLFLLASDGLTGMLDDPELAKVLMSDRSLPEKVDDLINRSQSQRRARQHYGHRCPRRFRGHAERRDSARPSLFPHGTDQTSLCVEPGGDFLAGKHDQIHDAPAPARAPAAARTRAQPPGAAVQLSRDPRQAQVRRRIGAGQLSHRAVSLHQRQVERQHFGFGGKSRNKLARRQSQLPGQAVLHPEAQPGVVARPRGRRRPGARSPGCRARVWRAAVRATPAPDP